MTIGEGLALWMAVWVAGVGVGVSIKYLQRVVGAA